MPYAVRPPALRYAAQLARHALALALALALACFHPVFQLSTCSDPDRTSSPMDVPVSAYQDRVPRPGRDLRPYAARPSLAISAWCYVSLCPPVTLFCLHRRLLEALRNPLPRLRRLSTCPSSRPCPDTISLLVSPRLPQTLSGDRAWNRPRARLTSCTWLPIR
ncbi:hypothetical protein BS50DRAFT_26548 [Corynespora cassiicola Philippines]|uniref:Uncharacterized protein n=1 Tax=Corynespora cassiicola Philippines TaxID=1448308 RepID=A0A2T2PC01_CORCC|nr:hypothetical protein BS50DRAFT_26548 [Corynespora cassiicola Philippines]